MEAARPEHPLKPKLELEASEHMTDFSVDGALFAPLVDIYEDDKHIYIVADMPGVRPEDVEVTVRDHELVVNGRIVQEQFPGEVLLYQEYAVGHWHRHFRLTEDVDRGAIEASMENGILTITLPKAHRVKARRIPVRTD
jgi:HSP20 family protein